MLGRTGKNVKEAIKAYLWGAIPHSYAGDVKIYEVSVRVASVQAEIRTHVNTYKKR
jgi:hypothetical protein